MTKLKPEEKQKAKFVQPISFDLVENSSIKEDNYE